MLRAGPRKDLSFIQITEQYLELTSHHHVHSKRSHVRLQMLGKAAAFDGAANVSPPGVRAPCRRLHSLPPATIVLQLISTTEPDFEFLSSAFFFNPFPLGS